MGRGVYASAETSLGLSSDPTAPVTWDVTLSRHTQDRVDQLARDIGGSREDVFKKAIALLSLAVKARQEGKGIAIVDADGSIDTEITGF